MAGNTSEIFGVYSQYVNDTAEEFQSDSLSLYFDCHKYNYLVLSS